MPFITSFPSFSVWSLRLGNLTATLAISFSTIGITCWTRHSSNRASTLWGMTSWGLSHSYRRRRRFLGRSWASWTFVGGYWIACLVVGVAVMLVVSVPFMFRVGSTRLVSPHRFF